MEPPFWRDANFLDKECHRPKNNIVIETAVPLRLPLVKSTLVASLLVALCVIGAVLSILMPLPGDLDKIRLHAVWFPASGFFASATVLLTLLSALFITFLLSPFLGGQKIGNLNIPAIQNPLARRLVAAIGWFGVALLLIDTIGFPGLKWSRLPKTWRLTNIEKAVAAQAQFTPVPEPTFSSVRDRYLAANSSFLKSLTEGAPSKAVLLVTAPGGFGKSFLMNELRQRVGDRFKLYKLTSFGGEWTTPDLVVRQANDRVTLNRLLSIPRSRQEDLLAGIARNIEEIADAIVVVDEFDEIDPEIARSVLGRLSVLAEQGAKPCRVVAVGRPEAFASYLSDPRRPFPVTPKWIPLNPPIYSTKGDVESLL